MNRAILATGLVVLTLVASAFAQQTKERPDSTKLDGAWKLVSHQNGDRKEQGPITDGATQTKLLVDGRYVWTVVKDGKVLHGLGGRYTVDGEKYTEHIEFAFGEEFGQFVGKPAHFKRTIEGGKWRHKGVVKIGNAVAAMRAVNPAVRVVIWRASVAIA